MSNMSCAANFHELLYRVVVKHLVMISINKMYVCHF